MRRDVALLRAASGRHFESSRRRHMSSSSGARAGATLLFAHGGGFCKQIWDPIIRRLQASPLLKQQHPATRIVTFDFPYHGTRSDESVPAKVVMQSPTSPRVIHPANQHIYWSAEEAYRQVQAIRAEGEWAPLIGIGHSMGAVALWRTEVKYPGTFDGLILFEPVHDWSISDDQKPSREAAAAHFEGLRNFAAWDRESLTSYLQGALVESSAGSKSVSLACHPLVECALYSGEVLMFSDNEFARPQCRTVLESGERTQLFNYEMFCAMAERHPSIYKVVPPMPKTSHLQVLEDPAEAARRILDNLTEFAPFQDQDLGATHPRL